MKKILLLITAFLLSFSIVHAQTAFRPNQGGTGQTSYTIGDILYASATNALSKLGIGSPGQCLGVSGGIPAWIACATGGGGLSTFSTTTSALGELQYPTTPSLTSLNSSALTSKWLYNPFTNNQWINASTTIGGQLTTSYITATSSATSTLPALDSTYVTIGSDTINDFTGDGITATGGKLNIDRTGAWTGTFDGQEGSYYLDARNLTAFGTPFYTFFSATTTTALAEGTNLYWTDTRFDNRLSATTSLPNITTLAGLSLPASQVTGIPTIVATSTNPLMATYMIATSTTATSTFPKLSSTYIQIGNETINDFTGDSITVTGGKLNVDRTGDWTGTLDSIDGGSFLRSDASDNYTSGTLSFDAGTVVRLNNTATTSHTGGILSSTGLSASYLDVGTIHSTSTASSTFIGGLEVPRIRTTATSTGSSGFNLTGGCFSINGNCIAGGGGGSGTVNSGTQYQAAFYASNGTAVSGTSTLLIQDEKVSIGTTTSTATLNVGGLTLSGTYLATNESATSTFLGPVSVGATTTSVRLEVFDEGGSDIVKIRGAHGIGSKNYILLGSSGPTQAGVRARIGVYHGVNGTGDLLFETTSNPAMVQGPTATTERMRILSGGNIGIATTSPYTKLSVWGDSTTDRKLVEFTNSASTTVFSVTNNGTTTLAGLNISASATSTSNVGYNISTGCYAINNTCISGSGGVADGTSSSTLHVDNNVFSGLNRFSNTGTTTFAGGVNAQGLDTDTFLTVGSDSILDLTGSGLLVTDNALTLNRTGDWTGTLDSIEGASFLRSDASDNYTSGTLSFDAGTTLRLNNTSTTSLSGGLLSTTGLSSAYLDVGTIHATSTATSTFVGPLMSGRLTSASAAITGLVSCDTIDTDASGNFRCGTDNTSAGAASTTLLADNNVFSGLNRFSDTGTTTFAGGVNVQGLDTDTFLTVGSDSILDLTGSGLLVTDNALTLNRTGDWTGTLDSIDGASFLRSDTSDNFTSGTLSFDSGTVVRFNNTATTSNTGGILSSTGLSALYLDVGYIHSTSTATSTFAAPLSASRATTATLSVTGLASCDTIDTDATGNLRCGTDSDTLATTTLLLDNNVFSGTNRFINNLGIATSSTGTALGVTGAGVFTDRVTATHFYATSTSATSTFAGSLTANRGTTATLSVTGLVSCDTVDTDATGNLRCGTDLDTTASSTLYADNGVFSGLNRFSNTGTTTFAGGINVQGLDTDTFLTVGSDSILDLTGSGLLITDNALTLNRTGDWTGTLDSIDGASFLRSDASDNFTSGTLSFDAGTTLRLNNTSTTSLSGGLLTTTGLSANYLDVGTIHSTSTATSTFVGQVMANRGTLGSFAVTGLTSCDTIDTDATGNFRCGNDATGGGSVSGGTAGMITSWIDATTLAATGTPTAGNYFATSTVASQFPYASTTMISAVTASSSRFITNPGTVDIPSYGFSGSSGLGIYRPNVNQLGFAVQGELDAYFDGTKFNSLVDISSGNSDSFYLENNLAGAADSPVYSFVGDTTIGMFRNGSGYLGFSTAGIERLIIDSEGKLGVATATPFVPLSVNGSGFFGGSLSTGALTATGTVRFSNLANCDTLDTNSNGVVTCGTDASGGSLTGGSSGMLASWINSTTLAATGTPSADRYIATSTSNDPATPAFSLASSAGLGIYSSGSNQLAFASQGELQAYFDGTQFKPFVNISSGTSRSFLMDVDAGQEGAPTYSFVNDPDTGMYSDVANTLKFSTNSTNRMLIGSTGNVGIGTSTPGTSLGVTGAGVFTGQVTAPNFYATSTSATSTFLGGISTNLLNVTSTSASSTFANGINLTGGCFSINGSCISGGGGVADGTSSSTLHVDNNVFSGNNRFTSNLGIATSSTGTALGVTGAGVFTDRVTATHFYATSSTATSTFAGSLTANRATLGTFSVTGLVSCDSTDTDATGNFRCGTDATASTTLLADNNVFSGTNRFISNLGIATSSAGTALGVTGAGVFTDKVTAPNFFATSTSGISTFLGLVDIGGGVLEIPNGTGPTVDSVGEIAVDTTSDQLIYFGASAKRVVPYMDNLGFAYATTSWTGTTTVRVRPAPANITVQSAYCETNTGTVGVSLYDGTNRALFIPTASTTINRFNYPATNNSFTAGESIRVDLGQPASSPTTLSCTFNYTYDAD